MGVYDDTVRRESDEEGTRGLKPPRYDTLYSRADDVPAGTRCSIQPLITSNT